MKPSCKLYEHKKLDMKKPEEKKCKGIRKCVVKNTLTFIEYKWQKRIQESDAIPKQRPRDLH